MLIIINDARSDVKYMKSKEREVIVLLQDYRNDLPAGPQDAYVEASDSGFEGNTPLTTETFLRMNTGSLVGQTYWYLNKALRMLEIEDSRKYRALYSFYFDPDAGHNDVNRCRTLHPNAEVLREHDAAIKRLGVFLGNVELYVRHPYKSTNKVRYESVEIQHKELYIIYLRYVRDEFSHDIAVEEASKKMDYDLDHAGRVIEEKNRAGSAAV